MTFHSRIANFPKLIKFTKQLAQISITISFNFAVPLLSTPGKDDNSPSNYFINCPQCHQGLSGFQVNIWSQQYCRNLQAHENIFFF